VTDVRNHRFTYLQTREPTMPKMKSHSGTSKRVKVTGSGKLVRLHTRRKAGAAFASTPVRGSRKNRRRHAGIVELAPSDTKRAKRLLGL
jgi:large subunit ribosomal protein L35